MNIYQKLIEVRKTVPYLKKDNKGFQFQYVSSSQTLGSLKQAMDEQGLLLIPRVTAHNVSTHETSKGAKWYLTELTVQFTWVNAENPEEVIVCDWYGQGLDDGEKGVGKALTYGEKYFLLKFFNIATDKDDPDSFQKEHTSETKLETPWKTEEKPEPKSAVKVKPKPVKADKPCDVNWASFWAQMNDWGFDEAVPGYKDRVHKAAALLFKRDVDSLTNLTQAEYEQLYETLKKKHEKEVQEKEIKLPF